MMDGMMMGGPMMWIGTVIGILITVLLVVLIVKLLRK